MYIHFDRRSCAQREWTTTFGFLSRPFCSARRAGISRFLGVAMVCGLMAAHASAQQAGLYDFVVRPTSGFQATVAINAATSGTLIGNYDETNNATGTRTKPGLFGSFGATENVATPVTLGFGLNGTPDSTTSGGFRMNLNPATGTASISGLSLNLLADGPASLPATLALTYDSFRTRSPSSTYIGGIPLNIPIGTVSLNTLTATQVGEGVAGTLTEIDSTHYSFTVAPLVTIDGMASALGNDIALPGTPAPFPLQGELAFSENGVVLTSLQPIDNSQSAQPNQMLPQFPLALPTILPPGDTANVLFDLTLTDVTTETTGNLQLTADGTLAPEPGTGAMMIAIGMWLVRRRPQPIDRG